MAVLYKCFKFIFSNLPFKDTLKVLDDFKNKQKSVRSNTFWYVKVYIYLESLFNTLYIEKNTNAKKISLGQNECYKIMRSFFSHELQLHHSFNLNLQFLYELKHKVHLSIVVCRIFHFRFCLVFIKVYIFVQRKTRTLWL